MSWILAVRLVIVGLVLRRLATDFVKARSGEIPATRLVLPVAVVAAALLVANHIVPRVVVAGVLLALDVVFLVLCVGIVRSLREPVSGERFLEDRLYRALDRFFPEWFARLASVDVTVCSHALEGAKAFVNPARSTPYTYANGSKLVMMAVIVALSVVPDAFLFWILLPKQMWWLALLLDLLDIWACLWLFGLFGTMVRRPHEIHENRVVFRNGIFQTVSFNVQDIADVEEIGVVKRYKLPRKRGDGSTVLSFGGVPMLAVRLTQPALENHAFLPAPRQVTKIYVASDAPSALRDELLRLARSAQRSYSLSS